ncbi:ABC transporter permease [Saccharopolyspora sp. NPDC049426]|uniref:ABC transporter permease n=1 Tax=Saccharopolyspora sp. NPDC049426 TaxID=3155652 RepID=UPI0034377A75
MTTTTTPDTESVDHASLNKSSRDVRALTRQIAPSVMLLVLVAAVSFAQPAFLSATSLQVLVEEALPILLLALGQMAVVLVGGIDLSIAAASTFASVLLATALAPLGPLAPVLAIVVLTLGGAIVGMVAAYTQVPSFIVSLGALGVWQALALLVSDASTISVTQHLGPIGWLVGYTVLGLPLAVWAGMLLTIVAWLALKCTVVGSWFFSIGRNEKAALMSGMATRGVKVLAFAWSGTFAGIAGVILTAKQYSAAPGLADELLLPTIAAVIVGGCVLTGGVGHPLNVLIGAVILTVLRIGTTVADVDPKTQQIIYGAIIIVAVALTLDRTRLSVIK